LTDLNVTAHVFCDSRLSMPLHFASTLCFCRVTESQPEEKTCQLHEALSLSNADYQSSVCGPATYVVDQTPSFTEVPSNIVCILCESQTMVFSGFFDKLQTNGSEFYVVN